MAFGLGGLALSLALYLHLVLVRAVELA